ncbi:MAG: MBL fold metallo-hydrolase [Eubacteriales bacterium]|nr:MBL fold metallo-hydrolase [Eubacteriales bacterium]
MKHQICRSFRFFLVLFCSLALAACGGQAETEPLPDDDPIQIEALATPGPTAAANQEASAALSAELPITEDFAILFVNVGKADAAVLRFGQTAVLIDTGSEESVPNLLAGLNALNVHNISAVFLTHSHSDHIGGLASLAANYTIPVVYSPYYADMTKSGLGKIVKRAEMLGLNHTELKPGETVEVAKGVTFSVLGPLVPNQDDDNDNSLILQFSYHGKTFLFTGDMQFAEEQTLIDSGVDLKSDLIKVGNHGNPDATGADFAALVSPSLAVISTDTSVDADSANPLVLSALGRADVYVTQDFPIGILITQDSSGNLLVSNPTDRTTPPGVAIQSIDTDRQSVTLINLGSEIADLSGCVLVSERSGATLQFPDGVTLAAGESLEIISDGRFSFPNEEKPLSKKKENTVALFGLYGAKIDTLEK